MPRYLGHRAGLSRENVLTAARDVAHKHGLDKLTIRSLAERLDVAPNAVYRWIESKAALLDALVDDALVDVPAPRTTSASDRDPIAAVKSLLLDAFDAMMRRPELAPLFMNRAASPGPNAARIRALVTELLTLSGASESNCEAAVPVLVVHVMGFAAFVHQTRDSALLAGPHLGSPRDLVDRGLDWLLTGATTQPGPTK